MTTVAVQPHSERGFQSFRLAAIRSVPSPVINTIPGRLRYPFSRTSLKTVSSLVSVANATTLSHKSQNSGRSHPVIQKRSTASVIPSELKSSAKRRTSRSPGRKNEQPSVGSVPATLLSSPHSIPANGVKIGSWPKRPLTSFVRVVHRSAAVACSGRMKSSVPTRSFFRSRCNRFPPSRSCTLGQDARRFKQVPGCLQFCAFNGDRRREHRARDTENNFFRKRECQQ
ncbi:hypothetical protein REJC140_02400 [Pseudorhizobium endolithicum]|uniref:Uncharacterized protein n=1 Tax=Pseudorhizobium endolithicum TaxID=1191678 RepID=A0ABM8PF82_9HYPH|nr:hypothetical protein REJC140_02400 [Pseudorhizobium endolithicum]